MREVIYAKFYCGKARHERAALALLSLRVDPHTLARESRNGREPTAR